MVSEGFAGNPLKYVLLGTAEEMGRFAGDSQAVFGPEHGCVGTVILLPAASPPHGS